MSETERLQRTTLNEFEPDIPGIPLDDLKRRLEEGAKAADLLTQSGLLFEINRKVLHPLGLALGYQAEDDKKAATFFLLDRRDDPEGMVFAPDTFTRASARLDAYMRERGEAALANRRQRLGFVEQREAGPEFTEAKRARLNLPPDAVVPVGEPDPNAPNPDTVPTNPPGT